MQIVEEIKSLIKGALDGLNLEVEKIELEHPSDLLHGDYSSNVAMQLAKVRGSTPYQLAEAITKTLSDSVLVKRVEVAGSGFINFYLSEIFFINALRDALMKKSEWGAVDVYRGKSFLIEHSSPNLFKPFHIGHLVNNTYGEALVRIVGTAGANITPLSFPSDVSPGIAKAVWGILDAEQENDFTVEQIGNAYVRGVNAYKDDEDAKKKIDEINTNLYIQNKPTPEWAVYKQGRKLSLEYFQAITSRLGSKFNDFIFESESEVEGKRVIKENTPEVFEESEGAIIFRGSKHGLFDNVYINSAGFGTYLAKDIGLLSIKFEKYNFDTSITVTDIEQKQHFELVKKSAELVNKKWAEKSLYLQHGRLSLTTGKISSRSGGVPLASDILDTVKSEALKRMKNAGGEPDIETAEKIAIGAIKYAIARVGMGKNIVFDLEKSLSFEGDSGPYLQYTYARCHSVLNKADERGEGLFFKEFFTKFTSKKSLHGENRPFLPSGVEKLLYRFPEVVARAAREYEPHYVATYLTELASAFNSWYAKEQILDGTDVQNYKLAITEAVANTIKNGLWVLGIEAPEKM